jgi:hypothetical protein
MARSRSMTGLSIGTGRPEDVSPPALCLTTLAYLA